MEKLQNLKAKYSDRKKGFLNLTVLDINGVRYNQGIVTAGEEIIAAGSSESIKEAYKNDVNFVDAKNWLVTPGLINAHTHTSMSFLRDFAFSKKNLIEKLFFPTESHLKAEMTYHFALSSLIAGLKSGVTSFVDHYYFIDGVCKAIEELGVRGVVGETLADRGTPFSDRLSWDEVKKQVDNWAYSDRLRPAMCPHAMDTVSPDYLKQIAQYAKKNDLVLHMHLSQTELEKVRTFNRHNLSPVFLANEAGALFDKTLAVHLISAGEFDVKLLKEKQVNIVCCPTSQVVYEKLAPIELFSKYDLNISVATDCAATSDMNLHNELKFFGLMAKDRKVDKIQVEDLFNMVTKNPGKAIGYENYGVLESGSLADLVFIRPTLDTLPINQTMTHFVFSMTSNNIRHVMCNGKWVLWDREACFIDEQAHKSEYLLLVKELMGKAGLKS